MSKPSVEQNGKRKRGGDVKWLERTNRSRLLAVDEVMMEDERMHSGQALEDNEYAGEVLLFTVLKETFHHPKYLTE